MHCEEDPAESLITIHKRHSKNNILLCGDMLVRIKEESDVRILNMSHSHASTPATGPDQWPRRSPSSQH